jgi:hypothetical protein
MSFQHLLLASGLVIAAATPAQGQDDDVIVPYKTGQNIAPVFEGWEPNPDGSFNMVFGYMNRNYEEVLDIPVGPNNAFEPGARDQGQPTHFFPRRSRFVFRVKVPKDFGSKELVWTLTAYGKSEKAYATLKPEYVIDKRVMMMNNGGFGQRGNEGDNTAPTIRVDGEPRRTVKVGEALKLTAMAGDDGMPVRPSVAGGDGASVSTDSGLRLGWFVYRGAGKVTFNPAQIRPDARVQPPRRIQADAGAAAVGRRRMRPSVRAPVPIVDRALPVTVVFGEPGTYVLRAMAHDGGLDATDDVTVTVLPSSQQ